MQSRVLLKEEGRTSEKGSGKGLWNPDLEQDIPTDFLQAEFDCFPEGHTTVVTKDLTTFTVSHLATPNIYVTSRPLIHRKEILRAPEKQPQHPNRAEE